ncbi:MULTISPECIES: DNA-directed RNA polymerase subunit alpha [Acaryochloris]|uniref:DNA-directed RNA polymerase subunit alpha n=1 Tax=Acaryochloris marina (strain MBIC 11017) TaxID=329726 RepID=B0C430_ACAM1|nr:MULTISPECIES: DNA-directed RNA polymerase subunit alpha [Acaryochloris]ABW26290.1 DNA-directed RNA polymerase, alpha subunit [Acaryochloris marina MBIC11017]KAI9131118.1 DNA-directed RNA polymerase subunit alpha [Acaryochloris sp. CCMEE 5410]QUY41245.1 DNA-directed RNA polymerase subunit alpha [Acaryochloris marina S15]UJB70413.1 DNA-directed RNA polymerase subunit alpha [Acaryochloris sp. 'Moss Beach']BDM81113.1 DNA-directed RNA polymerase subunit alpha [Acaryochloris marina MBIC10699]
MAQFQVECLETTVEEDFSQYSRFILEPLDRGQGTTVGNALRRVLLANLRGTAVTAVRIAGVNHEFATIPGVREDVLDILLNMKQVVLRSHTNDPQIGRLFVQGPATVTTDDFELPTEVEIVNPTQYVATLSSDATLEMEFRIEQGKGYHAVGKNRDEAAALDFLEIDAIYMPVRRVNYEVEDARVGGALEKDRLILDIWTNGNLTPQESLSQAATILVDLFNPLKDATFNVVEDIELEEEDETNQIPIEGLNLSVRAYNCLKRAQINSVADLLEYSQEDLLEIKNFGAKSADEVIAALQDHLGITMPTEKSKS